MPDLTWFAWALLGVAALIVGLSKTAVPGAGTVAVAIFAAVLPAKQSTGTLLLLLIVADLFAVARLPAAHELAGAAAARARGGRRHPAGRGVPRLRRRRVGEADDRRHPARRDRDHAAAAADGRAGRRRRARTASPPRPTARSAASPRWSRTRPDPVMSMYFLASRFPVKEFLGTAAWFFAIVNLSKVPFSIGLGLITVPGLLLDLVLVPLVVVGALVGRWLAGRLDQVAVRAAGDQLHRASARSTCCSEPCELACRVAGAAVTAADARVPLGRRSCERPALPRQRRGARPEPERRGLAAARRCRRRGGGSSRPAPPAARSRARRAARTSPRRTRSARDAARAPSPAWCRCPRHRRRRRGRADAAVRAPPSRSSGRSAGRSPSSAARGIPLAGGVGADRDRRVDAAAPVRRPPGRTAARGCRRPARRARRHRSRRTPARPTAHAAAAAIVSSAIARASVTRSTPGTLEPGLADAPRA